jgi:hypothetical protein
MIVWSFALDTDVLSAVTYLTFVFLFHADSNLLNFIHFLNSIVFKLCLVSIVVARVKEVGDREILQSEWLYKLLHTTNPQCA